MEDRPSVVGFEFFRLRPVRSVETFLTQRSRAGIVSGLLQQIRGFLKIFYAIGRLNERLPLLPRYISGYIIGSIINRMDASTREAYAAEGIDCASLVFAETEEYGGRKSSRTSRPRKRYPTFAAAEPSSTT